jgi:hypothetical protein
LKQNANLPGMTRRRGLGAIWLLFLSLLITPAVRSQEAVSAEQLKAAFLYNFVRFVEWPTNAFANESAPMTIGVFGDKTSDKFTTELTTLLKDKKAHNRPLVVKKLTSPTDAATCQVVFVTDSESRRADQVADATRKKPILLVGESDDFLKNGGMINIVQDERQKQLRFDIAPKNAEPAMITISSHLLKLARDKTGGAK